jgi:hypothetical protein
VTSSESHRLLSTYRNPSVLLKTHVAVRMVSGESVGSSVELTGAFLSMGLMTNFLSLKELFLFSLQGKPIFGVNLRFKKKKR